MGVSKGCEENSLKQGAQSRTPSTYGVPAELVIQVDGVGALGVGSHVRCQLLLLGGSQAPQPLTTAQSYQGLLQDQTKREEEEEEGRSKCGDWRPTLDMAQR